MKKVMLTLVLLFSSLSLINAQDTIPINITDVPANGMDVCTDHVLAIYAETNCSEWLWKVDNVSHGMENPLVLQSQVHHSFRIQYFGCNFFHDCHINFREGNAPTSFTQDMWKRFGETMTIEPVGTDSLSWYEYLWSTGATTSTIDVIETGTYTCQISDFCSTATRTFIVQDNVELTSASCDLATGYNMLEWETSAQQATYVQSVNIYYDYDENCTYSELVANVDYNAGSYVDTSHDSYQYPCQYHVVAVGYDGEECPLRSYWCRTISLSDLMGTQGTQTLQWTPYTTERDIAKQTTSVLAYQIYDVVNGEAFYKATVGSFANTYNYDPSDFNGHGGVAAVLDGGKDGENMAFARTRYRIGDPDGTSEQNLSTFFIYPNPATGVINIRAMEQGNELNLTIVNSMGQVIYSGVVNGVFTTPRLTPGIYTVIADGCARKVVVE